MDIWFFEIGFEIDNFRKTIGFIRGRSRKFIVIFMIFVFKVREFFFFRYRFDMVWFYYREFD